MFVVEQNVSYTTFLSPVGTLCLPKNSGEIAEKENFSKFFLQNFEYILI